MSVHPPPAATRRGLSPLPLLLTRQSIQSQGPAHRLDFQARVGRPHVAPAGRAEPCVLVLTRSTDPEVDELSLRLAADGIPVVRLDSDLPAEPLCWDADGATLSIGGDLFAPVINWLRYFSVTSLPPAADAVTDSYNRSQWGAWMAVATGLGGATALNGGAGPGRPDRLRQLDAARRLGFATPATVVTNDLAAAARALPGDGDLIVKSLGSHCVEPAPGRLHGFAPQVLRRDEASGLEPAPVIVQAFVESRRELRVFVVGERAFGFEVAKPSPAAFWNDPASVLVRPASVSPALRHRLLRLARGWGLDVAGFDLLEPAGAAPVFLEVNAMCDWMVFEQGAHTTVVSEAVAGLVARAYRRATSGLLPCGCRHNQGGDRCG